MTYPIIDTQALCKVFYTADVETRALNNVQLSVNRGDYMAITGPSGCGKSTLLAVLGLLDEATSGEYRLSGHSTQGLNNRSRSQIRNREIGFIFQSFNLISDMTVWENVLLPLSYRKDLSKDQSREMAKNALQQVEMSHRLDHYPAQLSGGQQQRVAVARAIAGKPSLILADEPTGNLDSKNAEAVMKLLDDLHSEGATLCMVTHSPEFAQRAQRAVHMMDGRIITDQQNSNQRVDEALSASARQAASKEKVTA